MLAPVIWRGKIQDLVQSSTVSSSLRAISPTHPTLVREPFHRDRWVYEEKYDGWRIVAYKDGRDVRLVSRTGRDHTERFAEIAAAIARLPARTLILDGEVCAFDCNLVSHIYLLDPSPRSPRRRPCSWRSIVSTRTDTTSVPVSWSIGVMSLKTPWPERRTSIGRVVSAHTDWTPGVR